MPENIYSWATAVAAVLAILSTLARTRSRHRLRRHLAQDLELLALMPEGSGRSALEKAIHDQARRISTRDQEARLDRLRLMALVGAVLITVGLVPFLYYFLADAYPGQFPQVPDVGWLEAVIGLNASVGLVGGLVLLYAAGVAMAVKWVYRVSDTPARRILRGEALRQGWMKVRRVTRKSTSSGPAT